MSINLSRVSELSSHHSIALISSLVLFLSHLSVLYYFISSLCSLWSPGLRFSLYQYTNNHNLFFSDVYAISAKNHLATTLLKVYSPNVMVSFFSETLTKWEFYSEYLLNSLCSSRFWWELMVQSFNSSLFTGVEMRHSSKFFKYEARIPSPCELRHPSFLLLFVICVIFHSIVHFHSNKNIRMKRLASTREVFQQWDVQNKYSINLIEYASLYMKFLSFASTNASMTQSRAKSISHLSQKRVKKGLEQRTREREQTQHCALHQFSL